MNSINCLVIEGTVAEDATIKNGVATMPIVVTRTYKTQDGFREEACRFDVECYGAMADITKTNACKGRGVSIVGRMSQKVWKEKGKNRSKVFIVAEKVELKPFKKEA